MNTTTTETHSPSPPPDAVTPSTDSPQRISAAPSPTVKPPSTDDNSDDEFEFSAVFPNPTIAADELFSGGQIRPIYPIFNRDLVPDEKLGRQPLLQFLIKERDELVSNRDDLDGVPPESYCVWKPASLGAVRKSSSTGTSSCKRLLRDLMVGRSFSDGKEKFMFLAGEEKEKEKEKEKKKEKEKNGTEMDLMTAYRRFYRQSSHWAAAGNAGGGGGGGGSRRTYLPYKPGIGGFFSSMNGFSRVHNPF